MTQEQLDDDAMNEQLELAKNVIFKDGPIYNGTTNLPYDIGKAIYLSDKIPSCIQFRRDDEQRIDDQKVIFARTELDFVEFIRQENMIVFCGTTHDGVPIWESKFQDKHKNPYLEPADYPDRWQIRNISIDGYEALLGMEQPEDVIKVMTHCLRRKYLNVREVAEKIYESYNSR